MHRRTFVSGSLGLAAALALHRTSRGVAGTPEVAQADELPQLTLTLTDSSLVFPQPLDAGRYAFTVANTGASNESHSALGKIPDRVTDAEYAAWLDQLRTSHG